MLDEPSLCLLPLSFKLTLKVYVTCLLAGGCWGSTLQNLNFVSLPDFDFCGVTLPFALGDKNELICCAGSVEPFGIPCLEVL